MKGFLMDSRDSMFLAPAYSILFDMTVKVVIARYYKFFRRRGQPSREQLAGKQTGWVPLDRDERDAILGYGFTSPAGGTGLAAVERGTGIESR
jgi:hypothetical protein